MNSEQSYKKYSLPILQSGWTLRDTGTPSVVYPWHHDRIMLLLCRLCVWTDRHTGLLQKNLNFSSSFPRFLRVLKCKKSGRMVYTIDFLTSTNTISSVAVEIVISCWLTGSFTVSSRRLSACKTLSTPTNPST